MSAGWRRRPRTTRRCAPIRARREPLPHSERIPTRSLVVRRLVVRYLAERLAPARFFRLYSYQACPCLYTSTFHPFRKDCYRRRRAEVAKLYLIMRGCEGVPCTCAHTCTPLCADASSVGRGSLEQCKEARLK